MAKSILDLPDEMLIEIFSKIPMHDIVFNVQYVSKRWNSLVNEPELWRTLTLVCDRSMSLKTLTDIIKNAPYLRSVVLYANIETSVIDDLCSFCPNIRRLEFYDLTQVTVTMLEQILTFLPEIECLTLSDMEYDINRVGGVLSKFKKVKKLSLLHSFYLASQLVFMIADGCDALEYLMLDGMDVSDASIQHLISKKGHQLTGLILCGSGFTAASISNIKDCRKLKKFTYNSCSKLTESHFNNIVQLPTLKMLHLPEATELRSETISKGLLYLAGANLEDLDLSFSKINDDGVSNLALCTNLKCLNLAMCDRITDEALKHISKFKKLQKLNIKNCNLTDWGMQYLPCLAQLRYLNVSKIGLTERGLNHIASCKHLRVLKMNHCMITAPFVQQIATSLKFLTCLSVHDYDWQISVDSWINLRKQFNNMHYEDNASGEDAYE